MSDLMSQDTGYLGLIVCRGYQATMDEDRASGQRERIDTGIVNERELVRVPARLGLTRELGAKAVNVLLELAVIDNINLPRNLLRRLLSKLNVLFFRIDVVPWLERIARFAACTSSSPRARMTIARFRATIKWPP